MNTTSWQSEDEFKQHARAWAIRLGVRPKRIQLQRMERKWASCSAVGAVSFNRNLLSENRQFGEAVIVHELLHLKVRNHGPVFRSLLRAFLPDHPALTAVSCERVTPNRRRQSLTSGAK